MEKNICRGAGVKYRRIPWMNFVVSQFHTEQRLTAPEEK
jgi:hypothetical protein